MRTKDETHSAKFDKLLRGKKINSCRYMTREEADQFGWYKRPLIIVFTDESYIILQSDDEVTKEAQPCTKTYQIKRTIT